MKKIACLAFVALLAAPLFATSASVARSGGGGHAAVGSGGGGPRVGGDGFRGGGGFRRGSGGVFLAAPGSYDPFWSFGYGFGYDYPYYRYPLALWRRIVEA
jgi:hypothetical protein